jgi:hypothetical protein
MALIFTSDGILPEATGCCKLLLLPSFSTPKLRGADTERGGGGETARELRVRRAEVLIAGNVKRRWRDTGLKSRDGSVTFGQQHPLAEASCRQRANHFHNISYNSAATIPGLADDALAAGGVNQTGASCASLSHILGHGT